MISESAGGVGTGIRYLTPEIFLLWQWCDLVITRISHHCIFPVFSLLIYFALKVLWLALMEEQKPLLDPYQDVKGVLILL